MIGGLETHAVQGGGERFVLQARGQASTAFGDHMSDPFTWELVSMPTHKSRGNTEDFTWPDTMEANSAPAVFLGSPELFLDPRMNDDN